MGIDAGSSSTRWTASRYPHGLAAPATHHAEGRSAPLSALAFLDAPAPAQEQVQRLVATVFEHLDVPPDAVADHGVTLAIGMTGLSEDTAAADQVKAALHASLAGPIVHLNLMNDMTLAYRASLEPGAGGLLYAGTGSIAVHLDAHGRLHRAGGHGYRIDDAGGGFWLGRMALQRLLRRYDVTGAMPHDGYHDALYAAMGGDDWPTIKAWAYGGGRDRIASLARTVIEWADHAEDAHVLVQDAARELAALTQRLGSRIETSRWVATGGLLQGPHALTRALETVMPPAVEVTFRADNFAQAAETLATDALRAQPPSA